MRTARLKSLRVIAGVAVAAMLGLFTFAPAGAAQATTYVPINGSGSSYAWIALDQWAINLKNQGPHITYTSSSSAQGRQQYIENLLDFAGSDIAFITNGAPDPFAGVDVASVQFAYSYIPDVAGGLSFLYNLKVDGRKITNMRLSGRTLAEIFTGHIKNWDDPAITHDYGRQLPSIPITVVTRSDGAGESYFLTRWMWKQYPSLWIPFCTSHGGPPKCGTGPTEFFPGQSAGFKSLAGSDVLSSYVAASSNNGAIGYAEAGYARDYNVPTVSVLNAAGYYAQPTASNVAIALEKAQIDENQGDVNFLMQNLDQVYGDKDPRAYPLSSYSYLVVPRNSRTIGGQNLGPVKEFNSSKGVTLSTYVNYILCGAQASAANLGYSPLPKPMVEGGFLQETHIPGAVKSPAASNYNGCDNPAFHDGVDTLTRDAPFPSPCQKVGAPLNCKVVGGRAVSTGSGSGGSSGAGAGSGSGSGPGSGANGSTGPGSGNSGSGVKINPNTGQVESGNGPAATDVFAQPVGLASQPTEQWLFGVLTALVLTAAIVTPSLLGGWLQRSRRAGRALPGPAGPVGPPIPPFPPPPTPPKPPAANGGPEAGEGAPT